MNQAPSRSLKRPELSRSARDLRATVIGSLMYLLGAGTAYISPSYLSAVALELHLNAGAIGLLGGAEILGMALGCLLGGLLAKRKGASLALMAAAVCVLGDILSAHVGAFAPLTAIRFLTGLLGQGPLFAISFAVLGSATSPDRAIGVALTLTTAVAAVTMGLAASLISWVGSAGLFLPFLIAALALILTARWAPDVRLAAADEPQARIRVESRKARLTLAGIAFWFGAPGMFWAFAHTAGLSRGLPSQTIDIALSLSGPISILVSLVPVFLKDRIGRIAPITSATVGLVLAAILYQLSHDLVVATLGLALVNGFWNLGAVYSAASLAELDGGRAMSFAAVAQLVGQASGPLIGGPLIELWGYDAMPIGMAAVSTLGLALMASVYALRPRAA